MAEDEGRTVPKETELSFFSLQVTDGNADKVYADAFAADSEEEEDATQLFFDASKKYESADQATVTIDSEEEEEDDDTIKLQQKLQYTASPRVHWAWYGWYGGLTVILIGIAFMLMAAIRVHHTPKQAALWMSWCWGVLAPYNFIQLWARTPRKIEVRKDRIRIVATFPFKYDFKFDSFSGLVYTFDVHPEWRDTYLAALPAMYECGWNFGTARTRFVKVIRGGMFSHVLFNVKNPDQFYFNLKIAFDAYQLANGKENMLQRKNEEHLEIMPTDIGMD
mmetsp:Transcript_13577/g.16322  ORF Transcript_13577/g.16322 Transcript_13577/m.16322 type:complete len:278 (+) Transcript_13577:340-1173(+)|eukprot:CAMPEP_0197859634 /NCGR_PEP_ID=MMETSP1438-20131217/34365_1 /TAXON_ID=1461541 /ORGANISM="Pterosperma sp., Strain CCMP1384" /LENGTH=277 /DNA_ID=CAMNT_0043476201 /DNA_START=332 /DNA_END=1165 /DNA_ORIENTATION=-